MSGAPAVLTPAASPGETPDPAQGAAPDAAGAAAAAARGVPGTGPGGSVDAEIAAGVARLVARATATDGPRTVVPLDVEPWLAESAGAGLGCVVLSGLAGSQAPGELLRRLREDAVVADDGLLVVDAPDPTSLLGLSRVLDGSAGRPGPDGAPRSAGLSLAGLRDLLESAGWVLGQVLRVPVPEHAVPAAVEAVLRADPTSVDRGTAHHVVLARPAVETTRYAELVDRAVVADRRSEQLLHRVVLLERRLADTAGMLAQDRDRHSTLIAAGSAELAELRAARVREQAVLAERSRRLADAEAQLRALRAGPALAAGNAVLRVTRPARIARRAVGRRVRPLLRRLR